MLAIAAGLEQTVGSIDNKYSRLIVSRPVQPMGKDIGFLPGTLEEKMSPWLRPIQDNLQFLLGNDKVTLEMYMQKGLIEVEAMANEFPDFLLTVAKENWLRGYQQALYDVDYGELSKNEEQSTEPS